jgi:iron complex outermembrane receptor protein
VQHQWSEEVTIAQQRSRMSWLAGVFLFDEADRQPTVIAVKGPRLESLLNPRVTADAQAVFGQATLAVTPRVSATAGLRYSHEQKAIENAGHISTIDPPVTFVAGSVYAYTDTISYNSWNPKLGVELKAGEDALIYASATRGFKSGGFNLTSQEAGRGYAPEWVWSYEGGLKTSVLGDRVNINGAAFHTDYTDLQVQTAIRPGVIDISNAAEATIRGVELEGTARLTDRLHAGGHLAWLAATYDRYVAVGVGGVMGDVAGNRLTNAPEWSGRFWLQWTGNLGRAGLVSLRAESRRQSTVFFTPFNDDIQRQRSYGLVDGSGEFGPAHRKWSLTAWTRNLTNTDYITGSYSTPLPAIGGRPGVPRQAGVDLTIRM